MPDPNLPGGDEDADELSKALRKAADKPRADTEDQEIAADDAGGSTLAEESVPGRR